MNTPSYRGRSGILVTALLRLFLACTWLGFGICNPEVRAQGSGVSEYGLKALFVAKLPQFVKWPGGGGSITVGVLGEDPFGGALDQLVKVKRSKRVEDLKGCQVIFIAKSERGNLGGILASLAGANILTVGDSEGFSRQGGVIGLALVGDKVRFDVNTDAARRAGLGIDPRLLRLSGQ